MFLTASNFEGTFYYLPNLNLVDNSFQEFVDSIEEDVLSELLGVKMYDDFIAFLATVTLYDTEVATEINQQYEYGNDVWEALTITTGVTPIEGADWHLIETDNKWLRLKNGDRYSYNDKVYKWVGIVKLLLPIVYYRYTEENLQSFTGIGEVQLQSENSEGSSSMARLINMFNKFSKLAGSYLDHCYESKNTLYGFCNTQIDIFPDFCFTSPGFINEHDL